MYSHVINNRLLEWSCKHDKIDNSQFGLQPTKSTIDCIFVFQSIITKMLSTGEKLYCAFIDFSQAFDRIERGFLWYKLIHEGISSRMLRAVQAMYTVVKSIIKCHNVLSEPFQSMQGVKQGDPLSPLMFISFINDLKREIEPGFNNQEDAFILNELVIFTNVC